MAPLSSDAPLEQTSHIPIAELSPDLVEPASRALKAIVTLTWPFSSATGSVAFLLSEPDFRLRRSRGQVRVQFAGSCAKRIAKSRISSGDEIILCLDGVEWIQDSVKVATPGTGVEFELRFTERVLLKFRQEDSQDSVLIDLDHPPPEAELPIASILPDAVPESILLPAPPTNGVVSRAQTEESDEEGVYSSPAFVKRARTSYGSLFELDPFSEQDGTIKGKGRKRTRLSTAWTYTSRSPTPERECSVTSEPVNETSKPIMTDEGCQTMETDFHETGDAAEALASFARQSTNVGNAPYGAHASHSPTKLSMPPPPNVQSPLPDRNEEQVSENQDMPGPPRLQPLSSDLLSLVSPLTSRSLAFAANQFFATTESTFGQGQRPPDVALIDDSLMTNGHEHLYSASPSRNRPFANPIRGLHVHPVDVNGFASPESDADERSVAQDLYDRLDQSAPNMSGEKTIDEERFYAEGNHTESPYTQDDASGTPLRRQVQYPDLEEPSQHSPIPHWNAAPPDVPHLDIRGPNIIEIEAINFRPVSSAAMSRSQSARSQSLVEAVDLTESSDEAPESDGVKALENEAYDEIGSDENESANDDDSEDEGSSGAESAYNRQFVAPRRQAARASEESTFMVEEEAEHEEFSDEEGAQRILYRVQPMQDREEMEAGGSEEGYDEYEGNDMDEDGNYIDQNGNIVYPERRLGYYSDDEVEEGESEGSYEDDEAPQRPPQLSGPPVIIDLLSSDEEEEVPPAKVLEPNVQSRQRDNHPYQASDNEAESDEDETYAELQGNPLSDEEAFESEADFEAATSHTQGQAHYEGDAFGSEIAVAPEIHNSPESLKNDESPTHDKLGNWEGPPKTLGFASSPHEKLQKHDAEEHLDENLEIVIEAHDGNNPESFGQETEPPVNETPEHADEQPITSTAENTDHVPEAEETHEDSVGNTKDACEAVDMMEIDDDEVAQEPIFQDGSEEDESGKVVQLSVVESANEEERVEKAVTRESVTQAGTDRGASAKGLGMEVVPENSIVSVEEDGITEQEDDAMEDAPQSSKVEDISIESNELSPGSSQGPPGRETIEEDGAEPFGQLIGSPMEAPVDVASEDATDETSDEMVAEAVANPISNGGEPSEILVKKPVEETVEEEFQDIVAEAEIAAEADDSAEEPVVETLEEQFKEIVSEAVEEAGGEVSATRQRSQEPPNGKHTYDQMDLVDDHPHMKLRNAKHISPAKDMKDSISHFTRSKGAATSPPTRDFGLDGAKDDDEAATELPARSHRASTRNRKQLPTPNDTQVTHMSTSAEVSFASGLDSQESVAGAHGKIVERVPQVVINEEVTDAIAPSMSDPAEEDTSVENSTFRPRTRSRKALDEPQPISQVLDADKNVSADEAVPESQTRGGTALHDKPTKTTPPKATNLDQSSSKTSNEFSPPGADETKIRRSHRRVKSSTIIAETKVDDGSKATTVIKENVSPHTPMHSNRRTTVGSSQVQGAIPMVVRDEQPTPEGHDASVALALSTLESPSKAHGLGSPPTTDVKAKIQIARHLRTQLKSFAALKILKFSRGKKLDVMAIVTSTSPEPQRAKGGPRHYQITFNITDVSIAPNEVIQIQVSRPYKEALPIVKVGDGILLLGFHVHPASKGAFQLRSDQTESSSWSVFKDGDEVETRGPPAEYGEEEATHIASLKDWFSTLDETAHVKLKRANEKWD